MKIKKVSQSAGIIAEIEQNLDSNSEVNAPSVKAVKNAIEKSCILVRPTSNYSVENESNVYITLDNIANKNGDKFSLINNKVKVGKGVSKVKISAAVFLNDLIGVGYVWLKVMKNNIGVSSSINPKGTDSAPYLSACVPTFVMDVAEGDEIGLWIEQTVYTNTTIRSELLETYLFVEEF